MNRLAKRRTLAHVVSGAPVNTRLKVDQETGDLTRKRLSRSQQACACVPSPPFTLCHEPRGSESNLLTLEGSNCAYGIGDQSDQWVVLMYSGKTW